MNDELNQKDLYLSDKMLKAIKFAARAHAKGVRRDGYPEISHPVAVGFALATAGFNETIVIAGILHDVIEDTDNTYEDIVTEFGKEVADLVRSVTYDQAMPHDEGKEIYLQQLATAPPAACAISAADLLANRTDMANSVTDRDPNKVVSYDNRRLAIIKQRLNHPFVARVESIVRELHQRILN